MNGGNALVYHPLAPGVDGSVWRYCRLSAAVLLEPRVGSDCQSWWVLYSISRVKLSLFNSPPSSASSSVFFFFLFRIVCRVRRWSSIVQCERESDFRVRPFKKKSKVLKKKPHQNPPQDETKDHWDVGRGALAPGNNNASSCTRVIRAHPEHDILTTTSRGKKSKS